MMGCEGGSGFAEPVRLVAEEPGKPERRWLDVPDVRLDDLVLLSSSFSGREKLDGSRAQVQVRDPASDALIEVIEIKVDCAEPLRVGDRFGSVEVRGVRSTDGGAVGGPD